MSNELRCLTSISKLKYVCITDSITSKKESSKKIASLTSSLLDAKFPKIKQTRTTNSCKIIIKETNIMEHCIRLAIHLAPVVRASDISRKKKQNFAGFSRANSRKNWPISQDFRGRKVKIRRKIGQFRGILAEKNQISKDFHGQIHREIGRFRGILGEKKSNFEGFSGANS